MDATLVATVLVAVVAGLFAYASQRSASKASKLNTQATVINTETTSRVDMEKEAYQRARKFDLETIARQDIELVQLRARVVELESREETLEREVERLKRGQRNLRT